MSCARCASGSAPVEWAAQSKDGRLPEHEPRTWLALVPATAHLMLLPVTLSVLGGR